jgi:hypothetical protein
LEDLERCRTDQAREEIPDHSVFLPVILSVPSKCKSEGRGVLVIKLEGVSYLGRKSRKSREPRGSVCCGNMHAKHQRKSMK